MNYTIGFLVAVMLLFILGMVCLLSMKYFLFGIKFFFAKSKYKQNLAAVFVRSRNGSLGLPYLVDDSKSTASLKIGGKKKDYPLTRKSKQELRWFDLPMYIYDSEDMQNELGLVYKNEAGQYVVKKDPNFVGSETLQTIIDNELLASEFNKLDARYKTVYMIVLGILIACAFNAYAAFEMLNYINAM